MKHTAFALALCLAAGGQCSLQQIHLMHSTASPQAPPITTLLPGFSYLVKVDCTGCSLLSASTGREDTRRTNALLLNFTIATVENYPLLLNALLFDPLYYERRIPMLMGGSSFYSAPPFTAYPVPANASAEDLHKYRQSSRSSPADIQSFELAYEHTYIAYVPKNPREWLCFLELDITGLRRESQDIRIDNDPAQGTGGFFQTVRILLSYDNGYEEKRIEAIELIPKGPLLETSHNGLGEKSIAGPSWGGRLNTSNTDQILTTHVSFSPAEWNDCGRKDEQLRQVLCKVEDFTDWLKLYLDPHLILTLFVVLCIIVFAGLCGLGWLSYRLARASWIKSRERYGRRGGENEAAQGLLDGDETLEDVDVISDEEKRRRMIDASMPSYTKGSA